MPWDSPRARFGVLKPGGSASAWVDCQTGRLSCWVRSMQIVWEPGVTIAVRVRATVTGHRRRGVQEHEVELAQPPGPATAGQIIEAAVRAEVAAFRARAEEASLVRVLTEKSLLDDVGRGAVRMGGVAPAGLVDV